MLSEIKNEAEKGAILVILTIFVSVKLNPEMRKFIQIVLLRDLGLKNYLKGVRSVLDFVSYVNLKGFCFNI